MHIHFLQHVPFEGLGCMEEWFKKEQAEITSTQLYQDPVFPEPEQIDWLVIMGGPMSANDNYKYPWMIKEKRFIEKAIMAQKKIIGVCLGAQLIADVLGAKITKNPETEIGWFEVSKVEGEKSSDIFKNFPEKADVFHWHGETFELPQRATRIFESQACRNQGFLIDDQILGLQFHFEITEGGAKKLIDACRDEMIPARYVQTEQEILSAPGRFEKINSLMYDVLEAFK